MCVDIIKRVNYCKCDVLVAGLNQDVEHADEGVTAVAYETFSQPFILNSSTESTVDRRW